MFNQPASILSILYSRPFRLFARLFDHFSLVSVHESNPVCQCHSGNIGITFKITLIIPLHVTGLFGRRIVAGWHGRSILGRGISRHGHVQHASLVRRGTIMTFLQVSLLGLETTDGTAFFCISSQHHCRHEAKKKKSLDDFGAACHCFGFWKK